MHSPFYIPQNLRQRRCGKDAAYCHSEAVTATAGRKPMRQCFSATYSKTFGEATHGNVCAFRLRIVKKLTKPNFGPNRHAEKIAQSDEPSFIRDEARRLMVKSPCAQMPRITGMMKCKQDNSG